MNLEGRADEMGQVFSSWKELEQTLSSRRAGQKVVFTNGCFDILHVGHVRYLQEASAQGTILVVGVNSDESVRRLKGPDRPLQNEDARAEILAALSCVDYVTLFGEDTPEKLIHTLRPDVLVKGGDYSISTIVGAEFVLSYGGEVKPLQFVDGFSTSSIIKTARQSFR
jgi:D-beta-D-heptose 7-phosphate kinase/D-beta-D-heptose 1-phosphate adenosyltransferase